MKLIVRLSVDGLSYLRCKDKKNVINIVCAKVFFFFLFDTIIVKERILKHPRFYAVTYPGGEGFTFIFKMMFI